MTDHQCSEILSYVTCSRRGKIERHGKWYCKQHDPEAVAAKRATREAEREAIWAADKKVREAQAAKNAAAQAVIDAVGDHETLACAIFLRDADEALQQAIEERKALS